MTEPFEEEGDQFQRMLDGKWYRMTDPRMEEMALAGNTLVAKYSEEYAKDANSVRPILEELLAEVGAEVHIRPPIFVDFGKHIFVGDRTFINSCLTALDIVPIRIGNDCQIGPNVQLITALHPLEAEPRRNKWEAAKEITIGNNVWLGAGVIVLPGVTIGDNSVVGAGSIVTKDIPSYSLAVGSPARVVRTLTDN